MRNRVLESQTGQFCPVLFENEISREDGDRKTFTGYTPNYLRVRTSTSDSRCLRNQIHRVRVLEADSEGGFLMASDPLSA